jgi:RNA polymerase sigma-70 factor (ECF subfamily)
MSSSRNPLHEAARRAWPNADWSSPRASELFAGADEAAGEREEELILAWACLLGDPGAIKTFEDRYIADVVPNLRGMKLAEDDIDEVQQRVRERLLVGGARVGPRLESYRGKGSLGGFVRTAAVRLALELFRQNRDEDLEVPDISDAVITDPELQYMRSLYADELKNAVASAWEGLDKGQRLLLRYQLQDRLGIDAIARLSSVHRATAARRCAAARRALIVATHRHLRQSLEVGGGTLKSILRLLESQIDLSLRES